MQQLPGGDRVTVVVALPDRHSQRGEHQVGVLGRRGLPSHDPLGEDVDDERDIDEPCPAPAVGEVRDPAGVGRGGGEVAVEQVPGAAPVLGRHGGPHAFAAPDPVHGLVAHQPIDGAERDVVAGPAQERGHLPSAIQAFWGAAGCEQRVEDHRIRHGSGGRARTAFPRPIGPRGDPAAVLAEHGAGRLDRVTFAAHVVDERHDQRLRGSSSPAKKTVAA
jgi:hypothetical protein